MKLFKMSSNLKKTLDKGSLHAKEAKIPLNGKISSPYYTRTGRKVQSHCSCRMVNETKGNGVTDQQKDDIFGRFKECKSAISTPNFIISHFTVFAIKRTKNGSSRGMPIHYNLPVGKHKVKVC